MADLQSRIATEADADELLRMMSPFNHEEGIPFSVEKFRPPLLKLLRDDQLGAVLLFETDALAGYALVAWGYDLEFGGRDAFLTEFWIEPHARGTGLGRKALKLAEEFAKTNGANALHLGVRHDNTPASRLYESSGYKGWPRHYMTKLL
jgi:ribosomal protein S18 acetylase RimI-like enzyme